MMLGLSIPAQAHATDETVAPEIVLLAISVADAERSAKWYRTILKMEQTRRLDGENGLVIIFLKNEELQLEIVQLPEAEPFNAPDEGNPASRHGVVKMTFKTANLRKVAELAKTLGNEPLIPLHKSESDGRCYLIVTDPDGNWVQFFGACSD